MCRQDVRFRIDAMILPRESKSRKPKPTMVSKGHLTACRKGRKKTFHPFLIRAAAGAAWEVTMKNDIRQMTEGNIAEAW